jgi:hypothetical protein
MARPPAARPTCALSLLGKSSCLKTGIFTPAMLSCFPSTRTVAAMPPSSTCQWHVEGSELLLFARQRGNLKTEFIVGVSNT